MSTSQIKRLREGDATANVLFPTEYFECLLTVRLVSNNRHSSSRMTVEGWAMVAIRFRRDESAADRLGASGKSSLAQSSRQRPGSYCVVLGKPDSSRLRLRTRPNEKERAPRCSRRPRGGCGATRSRRCASRTARATCMRCTRYRVALLCFFFFLPPPFAPSLSSLGITSRPGTDGQASCPWTFFLSDVVVVVTATRAGAGARRHDRRAAAQGAAAQRGARAAAPADHAPVHQPYVLVAV